MTAQTSPNWLRLTAAPSVQGTPWRPDALGRTSARGLRYLVVDDIFMTLAELSMSAWPVVDARGRLRFPAEEPINLEADSERMRLFLRRHRQPRRGASRDLRIGDAFGVRVASRPLAAFLKERIAAASSASPRSQMLDPKRWEWLRPPVYDLTPDARVAAKLAYYGALAEPLPEPKPAERSR